MKNQPISQNEAELEILTLLEAQLITLSIGQTVQQQEALEFWRILLRRLREDSTHPAFCCLSDFISGLYNECICELRPWNWESTETTRRYDELAA